MKARHLTGCLLLAFLAGCSEPVAGGSTDTETGAVAGLATRPDGSRVANASILAYPIDSSASGPAVSAHRSVSSTDGSYRLEGLVAGRWTLEFVAVDGYRGLLQNIQVAPSTVDSQDAVLHTPGRIRLAADADTTAPWIEGTAHLGRRDAGFWVVDSVPAGVPLALRRGVGDASRVVANLVLSPAQDTLLP